MSDQPAAQQAPAAAHAAPAPLEPPVSETHLTLTPPPAVTAVAETSAPRMAPAVPEAALPGLEAKVDTYLDSLLKAATKSPEWEARAADVRNMGTDEIRFAAESSNRMLQMPVKALNEGSLSQGSKVGQTLLDLRRTVEDLDPSQATGTKKLLGMIPFGDRITDYFRKYQSAQSHLNGILHSLQSGQDELQKDNIALNLEKKSLWDSMGRLNQYVYVAERLDSRLAAQVATLETTDPEKAKALREDVLFYVRQKHQDLLTQLAVSIQNYLAIDIIIKNNIELIVAQALNNQQLVLDQITALNATTSGLIERTSELLKTNSARIQEQSASSTLSIESLQKAFANIYDTMDSIDQFKVRALDNMAATIGSLETEVAKSRSYLERVSAQDARRAAGAAPGALDLVPGI